MALIKALLKVNGRYYAGLSADTYKSSSANKGWHNYTSNEYQKFIFSNDKEQAVILEGRVNIKSVMDSLFLRISDDVIDFSKIEVIKI